jgi:segregation and condensation protein A
LFKLLTVFEKVLKRAEEEKNKPVHQVIQYPYTIEGQKEHILNEVMIKPRVAFIELFEKAPTRIALIFNFLAILEMLANGLIQIQQGEGYNNFWVSKKEETTVSEEATN